MIGADLTETNLTDADLTGAILTAVVALRADMSRGIFVNANLADATFTNANLSEAVLRNANLFGTNLIEASLSRAIFINADLTDATFRDANLSGAVLRNANLRRTNLTGTNLTRADLNPVNLSDAIWFRSNISEANIAEEQKMKLRDKQVRGLDETIDQKSSIPTTQQTMEIQFHMEGNRIDHNLHSNLDDVIMGENNQIIRELDSFVQTNLSQALETLTKAITVSQGLNDKDKEEQIGAINQIREQISASVPNNTIIQYLVKGLLKSLESVPDVISTVTAVAPIFSNLHF